MMDLKEAYGPDKPTNPEACEAPGCFIASYAPVSKPGVFGPFNNNTHFLHPTRKFETVMAVPVRSGDFKCKD